MKITNTTKQEPIERMVITLLPGGIEAQEAQGQKELCQSQQLPADGDWIRLKRMGIKNLGPVPDDPIFVNVELPAGWQIKATDHSMWSMLVDCAGNEVASIFYKAAFYDRSAHIHVI